MTRFKLDPMPDADRVWWHRVGQPPLMLVRSGYEGYAHELPNGDRLAFYYWYELLAGGEVDTVDPDDVSWLPATPWTAEPMAGGTRILDAEREEIFNVYVEGLNSEQDEQLAALIARLVNEHVARHEKAKG